MTHKVKIIVATHKSYEFPQVDYYVPIHVGKVKSQHDLGLLGDDTGDNISQKNGSFCELTALYWVWKNNFFAEQKYVGLVHYRRYFSGQGLSLKGQMIASEQELLALLQSCDAIVAKKRNYYIETIYNHYKNAHHIEDLDKVREIISQDYPDYLRTFGDLMNRKKLHLFNMFVMKKELFDDYCAWVFGILFKLESQIDVSQYDNYQKRVFGFISERLFNVWLIHNNVKLCEVKVSNLEGDDIVQKVIGLLKRKFSLK